MLSFEIGIREYPLEDARSGIDNRKDIRAVHLHDIVRFFGGVTVVRESLRIARQRSEQRLLIERMLERVLGNNAQIRVRIGYEYDGIVFSLVLMQAF